MSEQVTEKVGDEWTVPVYGTWTKLPIGQDGDGTFVCDSPGPITTEPDQAYTFTFNGVQDVTNDDVRDFAESVRGMTQLRGLKLQGCPLSDEAAKYIRTLTHLEFLALPSAEMTDKTLKEISGLTNLRKLNLEQFNSLTDSGLASLANLKEMRRLVLQGCSQITDRGLNHLSKMKYLEFLNLNSCSNVTDAGLKTISTLPNLKGVDLLSCWRISDQGLSYLSACKKLKGLCIPKCGSFVARLLGQFVPAIGGTLLLNGQAGLVTDAGVKKLYSEFPELDLYQPNPSFGE